MSKGRSTFCPRPWRRLVVRASGKFHVCCASHDTQQNILRDDSGNPLSAAEIGFVSAMNSQGMKDVRQAMLSGERSSLCKGCWDVEDAGGESLRQIDNLAYKPFNITAARAITAADGHLHEIPKQLHLDIRLGRSCNLKCRMCGPQSSSLWDRDYEHLYGEKFFKIQPEDWTQNSVFWQEFEELLPHTKRLIFSGGEPLLIPEHKALIRRMIARGLAPEIELQYNTNATLMTQEFFSLWSEFRSVHLGLSLEGHGEVNDYIRFPSKWSTIESALAMIEASQGSLTGYVQSVVNIYNASYILEFMKWFIAQKFKKIFWNPILSFQVFPAWQSAQLLPAKAKQVILQEQQSFVEQLGVDRPPQFETYCKFLRELSVQLSLSPSGSSLEEFLVLNRKLDQVREQDLQKQLPKLWQHLNP